MLFLRRRRAGSSERDDRDDRDRRRRRDEDRPRGIVCVVAMFVCSFVCFPFCCIYCVCCLDRGRAAIAPPASLLETTPVNPDLIQKKDGAGTGGFSTG